MKSPNVALFLLILMGCDEYRASSSNRIQPHDSPRPPDGGNLDGAPRPMLEDGASPLNPTSPNADLGDATVAQDASIDVDASDTDAGDTVDADAGPLAQQCPADAGAAQEGGADAVSTYSGSTCAIVSGALYCWKQTWAGDTIASLPHNNPMRVGCERDWSKVSMGNHHTCGLRGGALYCWGSNEHGQLGTGVNSPPEQLHPVRVDDNDDWTAISAGDFGACGIRSGALYCWGAYDWEEENYWDASNTQRHFVPTRVGDAEGWIAVSALHMDDDESTAIYAYGIRAGELYLWDNPTEPLRQIEPTISDWAIIADGSNLIECAIRANGEGNCGMSNSNGGGWTAISAKGAGRRCGLRQGELYCWGVVNLKGGIEGWTSEAEPVRLGTDSDWSAVGTDGWSRDTCAIRMGRLYCWGGPQVELGLADESYEIPLP